MLRGIATLQQGIVQPFFWSFVALVILFIATISAAVRARSDKSPSVEGYYPILNLDRIAGLTAFFVFVGMILGLAFTGENPFVYFQF